MIAAGLPGAIADSFSIFGKAIEKLGETVVDLDVAESLVRLRIAGSSNLRLFTALLHRRVESSDAKPALTICVFEGSTSGLIPAILPELDARAPPGPHASAWRKPGQQLLRHRRPLSSLQVYDAGTRIGLYYLENVHLLTPADYSRPLHQIFRWWLAGGPWHSMHAAAVAGPEGGVLLGGKSGSGKSTTALVCARAGWRYAGDDLVLVRTRPEPRTEILYSSARVTEESLAKLGELRPAAFDIGAAKTDEKTDLILDRKLSREQFGGFPIRAVLLPRVHQGRETRVRPASRADALLALASSTMTVFGGDQATFACISELVNMVPRYWLDVGSDIDGIPTAIENLLQIATGRASMSSAG